MKNNIDVFYMSTQVPLHVLFMEDGEMDKKIFLSTWKDIPAQNEMQYTINNVQHNAGKLANLLPKIIFQKINKVGMQIY